MPSRNATEQPEIPLPVDRFENESSKNKTRRNSMGGKESAISWKQHSQNIFIHFPASVMQVYKQGKHPTG